MGQPEQVAVPAGVSDESHRFDPTPPTQVSDNGRRHRQERRGLLDESRRFKGRDERALADLAVRIVDEPNIARPREDLERNHHHGLGERRNVVLAIDGKRSEFIDNEARFLLRFACYRIGEEFPGMDTAARKRPTVARTFRANVANNEHILTSTNDGRNDRHRLPPVSRCRRLHR